MSDDEIASSHLEDHICAVCRVALDYYQSLTDESESGWVHPYAVERYVVGVRDHEVQPIPAEMAEVSGRYRCDFCFSPAPTWRYPCQSFTVARDGPTDYASVEDWAACDQCKLLIDRHDMGKLIQRAMSMGPSTSSRAHDPVVGKEVKRRLRALYKQFFAGLTGPATRIEG